MQIIQCALSLLLLGRAAAADGDAPSRLRVPGHKVVPSALRSEDAQVAMEEEAVFGALRNEWGGEDHEWGQEDDEWGKEGEDEYEYEYEPDWDMSMPNIMPVDEPECEWYEKKCDDGMCVETWAHACPGNCDWDKKKCDDGTCINPMKMCPGETLSEDEDEDEPDWDMSMPNIMPVDEPECEWYETECDDGMCIDAMEMCPGDCDWGQKKCDDGTCINAMKMCPGEKCGWHQEECDDGTCVLHWFESCAKKDVDLATE